ncbi:MULTISPECIES: hypothetical protein [unclassified Polynucleobacter]|uniref:hypothetical protein n=1 Tax=unclassified Polynucleobacter TaxID=2640945 RepID=UPI000BCBC786|nr:MULTISPECIES: hypothetical protein [unclassified Polynucleobacter]OYY21501.1 MAG: hypothetical protein B7Y67_01530 [Polynucleobacter sp. 35-46-11]OZA77804.1 MAG: hypothetical protein B7X71_03505 [Polynucleobacter sp. 39-46-10]
MRSIALLLLLIPLACKAFEPLNTDDAGTVPKGLNQIEQYFFTTASHGGGSANTVDIITPGEEYFGGQNAKAFPFTYTRGVADNIELSFGSTYFAAPRGSFSPLSNKVVAMKWRFAENDQWGLAVKPSITLPGSPQQQVAGLDLALPNYGVNLIASHYWDLVEVHLNATYNKSLYNTNYQIGAGVTENRTNIWFFSMAPVWKVVNHLRLALDIGLTTNPPSTEQYLSNYALVAAIISASDSLDIGISYMRSAANMGIIMSNSGINASRSEIGFTWRF